MGVVCGVMANVQDCDFEVSSNSSQSYFKIHFRTNSIVK